MKQYIEKSVITEEIKRLIKSPILYKSEDVETRINILEYLLSFLDTLEVKEVDLEKEINYWQGCEAFPEGVEITPLPKAMEIVEKTAKHFFELGLKVAQEGEL